MAAGWHLQQCLIIYLCCLTDWNVNFIPWYNLQILLHSYIRDIYWTRKSRKTVGFITRWWWNKHATIHHKRPERGLMLHLFISLDVHGKVGILILMYMAKLVFWFWFMLHLCKQVLISNAEQAETLIAQAVIKRATAMTNTNSQSRWVIKWNLWMFPPFLKGQFLCWWLCFYRWKALNTVIVERGCLKYVAGSLAWEYLY